MAFEIGDPVIVRDVETIRHCRYGCNRVMELMANQCDVIAHVRNGKFGKKYSLKSDPVWIWDEDCLMPYEPAHYGNESDLNVEDIM